MAKQVLNNGETHGVIRGKANDNFTELYNSKTEFDAHLADIVTDADGAHGSKIEQGTWTPVLRGLTTAGVNTYSVQRGAYYKINKKVTAFFAIELSAKDAAMAGEVVIHGLPFATAAGNDNAGLLSSIANLVFPANRTQVGLITPPTTAFIQFRFAGSGLTITGVLPEYINNNTTLYGEITYLTN